MSDTKSKISQFERASLKREPSMEEQRARAKFDSRKNKFEVNNENNAANNAQG